ncbi:DedA family protein [Mycobacterium sp. MBM]|nr:DedA family protein [Mycobacterium sp. MBM]
MTSADEAIHLDGAAGWAVDLMERLGGLGAGLAIFVENLFPPIPSEVILPMAGFAARLGELSLIGAIVWTTAGSVLGAWMLYALGAWLGHDRIRHIVSRMPLMDGEDVDKTRDWFAKHGHKAVFFGRMLPLFRSLISIPAGIQRMNFAVFTALTLLGSLIWNSVFVLAGYLLGANWHRIEPYASALQYLVVTVVIVGLGWSIRTRLKRRAGSRRAADFSPAK